MWVRGLKHRLALHPTMGRGVAPYVGAWIETISPCKPTAAVSVAPYVGAWIETRQSRRY